MDTTDLLLLSELELMCGHEVLITDQGREFINAVLYSYRAQLQVYTTSRLVYIPILIYYTTWTRDT